MARQRQSALPLSNFRNRGLFSNHWFENRLHREPEFGEQLEAARAALEQLRILWERQRKEIQEERSIVAKRQMALLDPAIEAKLKDTVEPPAILGLEAAAGDPHETRHGAGAVAATGWFSPVSSS